MHLRCCWILRYQKPERPWRGSRVLVLALSQEKLDHHKPQKPSDIQALALLEILDPIRGANRDAGLSPFSEVSSRLSLVTIQLRYPALPRRLVLRTTTAMSIARKLRMRNWLLWRRRLRFSDVFPHQKKLIIQTLKKAGHTTAMTGDGVNDILALREADCSIVMAEGDPATRQIANLVFELRL